MTYYIYTIHHESAIGTIDYDKADAKIVYKDTEYRSVTDFINRSDTSSRKVTFKKNGKFMFNYLDFEPEDGAVFGKHVLTKIFFILMSDVKISERFTVLGSDVLEEVDLAEKYNDEDKSLFVLNGMNINASDMYKLIDAIGTHSSSLAQETKMKVMSALLDAMKKVMN